MSPHPPTGWMCRCCAFSFRGGPAGRSPWWPRRTALLQTRVCEAGSAAALLRPGHAPRVPLPGRTASPRLPFREAAELLCRCGCPPGFHQQRARALGRLLLGFSGFFDSQVLCLLTVALIEKSLSKERGRENGPSLPSTICFQSNRADGPCSLTHVPNAG